MESDFLNTNSEMHSTKIRKFVPQRVNREFSSGESPPPSEVPEELRVHSQIGMQKYKVLRDFLNRVSGEEIDRHELDEIKSEYDICMIVWNGGNLPPDEKNFFISGKKRNFVKDVISQNTGKMYPGVYDLHIIGDERKVQPSVICAKSKEKNLSLLYLEAVGEIPSD